MTSELALLERARACDRDALAEIYDTYALPVYGYLYRRVHDTQLAEDLTSEVFVRVLQAIRAKQTWHTSFRGWLYRIAHNLVIDHYRRQPPGPVLELDEQTLAGSDDPESEFEGRLSRPRLRSALSLLTEDQLQVIVLRFGQRLTARQVGEVMEKSVSAVEALQHRALSALRRILEKDET